MTTHYLMLANSTGLGLLPPLLAVTFFFIAILFNKAVHAGASIDKARKKRPQRTSHIMTAQTPDEIYKQFSDRDIGRALHFYGSDESSMLVVLGTKHSLFSNGFYHVIKLGASNQGTSITINTCSKSIQVGPVVSKTHKTCVLQIQDDLSKISNMQST